MYMLHVCSSIRDGTYELGTPRHCIVSGSPCLQRSVWIGPPGLLGLTSSTRFLKHPARFFHPHPSLRLPVSLSASLFPSHAQGFSSVIAQSATWDVSLPRLPHLYHVQSTRCIRSTQPTGSLVRRPLFPLRPARPALFLWPLGFSPSVGRHATKVVFW